MIAFIVLALLITGCSSKDNSPEITDNGDDNSGQTVAKDTDTVTTDDTTGTGAGDGAVQDATIPEDDTSVETQIQDDTGTADDETTDTGNNALKGLFASRALKYTGEYTISADESMYDMTQVFDLPKYVTITIIGNDETRTIFDGTDMISCSSMDGTWQCFKMSVAQSQSIRADEEVNDGKATTKVIGTCDVAGETGTKYEVITTDDTKSQACYTSDGILLEMYIADPEYYMVAKTITRSIDDSVFVVPAEPQDIYDLMAGVPQ